MTASSSSDTFRPAGYRLVSSLLLTLQPGRGGRGADQVDHHFMTDQRFAPPVLGDGREQPVFDLVPLAGARRKVTHRNFQPGFIREFLQLQLPQAEAIAIAAARIGGDQQAGRVRGTPAGPCSTTSGGCSPRQTPPCRDRSPR